MKKTLILRRGLFVLAVVQLGFSQEVHKLPFASSANILELTVANSSAIAAYNVTVEAGNLPSWVLISPNSVNFGQLKPNEEQLALFTFSLDKSAPVKSEQILTFVIINSQGERWTKEIRISVDPPETFELFQNFPNPFNPATTISYQLPADSKILLRVYDLLGREVTTLVDEEKAAGHQQERFDAARFSSGMYVYQLSYTDPHGNPRSLRKTMLLVK